MRPGVLDGDKVIDLMAAGLPVDETGDLLRIVRGGDAMLERVREAMQSPTRREFGLDEVQLTAPLVLSLTIQPI